MPGTRFGRAGVGAGGGAGILVEEPGWVSLFELERWIGSRNPATAVLGVQDGGRPVVLDLRNPSTGHLIIEAPAGWGKSTLIRTVLISACWSARPSQLGVLAIDLSERELGVAEAIPHSLAVVARDVAAASELVGWLAREARHRAERPHSNPHVVLAVDDLEWLCDPDQGPTRADLLVLLEDSERTGIHLVGAAKPGVLSQLAGWPSWKSAAIARAAARGSSSEGCPRGTFVASTSSGSVRFHAACLSALDLTSAVRLLAGVRQGAGGTPEKMGRRASLSPAGVGGWFQVTESFPAAPEEVAR